MKFSSTSQIVLAGLAITGSSLAAPTPPLPFDSPIPSSPNPGDDWESAARSPRLHRSPFPDATSPRPDTSRLLPAIRAAGGVRRTLPRFKRQEQSSTDASSPEGEESNPSVVLTPVLDALTGVLHGVVDALHGIPGLSNLAVLPNPEENPQDEQPPNQESLPSPSELNARNFFSDIPARPPIATDQLAMLQNIISSTLQQQQEQAQKALEMLSAANSGQPVNPADLAARLQALRSAQEQTSGVLSTVLGTAQGAIGGVPIVGQVAPGLLQHLPLSGLLGAGLNPADLAGGVLGTVGGAAGGLLGSTPLGGILGATPLGSLLGAGGPTGEGGLLAGILGGASNSGIPVVPQALRNAANQGLGIWSSDGASGAQAPPNSPVTPPGYSLFGTFAADAENLGEPLAPSGTESEGAQATESAAPAPPPNSPMPSPTSVPMDHSTASIPVEPTGATEAPAPGETTSSGDTTTSAELPSESAESAAQPNEQQPKPIVGAIGRRQESGDAQDDAHFQPSIPDSRPTPDEMPPLLAPSAKRGHVKREGGPDAVPGPQDALQGIKSAPKLVA